MNFASPLMNMCLLKFNGLSMLISGFFGFTSLYHCRYLRSSFIGNLMSLRSSRLIRDLLVSKKLIPCADLCQEMLLRPFIVRTTESNKHLRFLVQVCIISLIFRY